MKKRDIVCYSHLNWDSVYQRPNHLMARAAVDRRVYFVEDPRYFGGYDRLEVREVNRDLFVVSPRLSKHSRIDEATTMKVLIDEMLDAQEVVMPDRWFQSPMMWKWANSPSIINNSSRIVYDCMDELSLFKDAKTQQILAMEADLMRNADIIFTGGKKLYEVKKDLHRNVHPMPSGVDVGHFMKARRKLPTPGDQALIPIPRVGWAGVIDERHDFKLLAYLADRCRHMNFVMIGPFTKVDVSELPIRKNIHYLGIKKYEDLPAYMAGWNAAIMTFALNDSTKFISPTKTPEYLAAGLRVVSTAIDDVVDPYEHEGLVQVARSPEEFERMLRFENNKPFTAAWEGKRDDFLKTKTWDSIWKKMDALVDASR